MSNLSLSVAAINRENDAVLSLLNGGYLRLFAGQRPLTPDDAPTDSQFIIELRFGSPAFQPSKNGVAEALPLYSAPAETSSLPAWFRTFQSDGKSAVLDGDCGSQDADLIITESINVGQTLVTDQLRYGVAIESEPQRSDGAQRGLPSRAYRSR